MNKAPAPSQLTTKQLDQIMVSDTQSATRFYKSGNIDRQAEAANIDSNRRRQKEDNYQEYRTWYKGLTPAGRNALAKDLGW